MFLLPSHTRLAAFWLVAYKRTGTYVVLGPRRWEVEDERAKYADHRVDDGDIVTPSPSGMDEKQRGDVDT